MRHSWILITVLAAACGSSPPPAPSPGPGPSSGESITGRERIGWEQAAGDTTELAAFRYAIYVDGVRSEIADASCSTSAAASGFSCSGKLPPMSAGTHTLELAAFVDSDGGAIESARSTPLRVVVSATSSAAITPDWQGGALEPTADGLRLHLDRQLEGLDRPADAAFTPDGRLFIAERSGRIRAVVAGEFQSPDALSLPEDDEGARYPVLSLAVDPQFAETRFMYVAHPADSGGGPVIRLARYREVGGRLAQRAVLFESPTASVANASAVVRFGADGKLYLAAGGGDGSGRLFRMNADGTLPRDQAGTTPAVATGITSARGLGWAPGSGILWIADDDGDRGQLSALSMSAAPVRAIVRGRRALRPGAGTLAFYGGDALPAMRGDALIASSEGYILRLGFGDADPSRVTRAERLLEDRVGPVRAVVTGPDGGIYFCTDTALGRLTAMP